MKKYWSLFKSLFRKKFDTPDSVKSDIRVKTTIMIVLGLGALLLSIINLFGKQWMMMYSTIALTAAFLLSAFLVGVFKLRLVSQLIVSVSVCVIFSFYGWIGGNQGFAILWIAIVPLACMLFLDFGLGFAISVYFLLYVIVLLYILPLFNITPGGGYYNEEFFRRFPALYLISFVVSIFLSGQRIYYQNIADHNSLYDALTGLKNRRFYSEYIAEISGKQLPSSFTVVSADLNNLKVLNDVYGHDFGDKAIIETGRILTEVFGKYTSHIFRTGGDEYSIFLDDKNNIINDLVKETKAKAAEVKIRNDVVSVSIGIVRSDDYSDMGIELLVSIAERNMYSDKEEFYKQFHGERRRESILNDQIQKELEQNDSNK